jgi:uncharacterized membrane protein
MQTRSAHLGFVFMAVTAIGVALWSERFVAVFNGAWPFIDPGIRSVVSAFPARALTHMLIAPLALLLGPFQFMSSIRARAPRVHRYIGRIYVASCVIAGAAGFATALHSSGGPVAGWGFGILAVLWVGTTLGGLWAAMQRRFELHRLLMRLSYAMTFGAVTLRLQIPIGFMLGYSGYPAMSVWLAYTSWIPNVLAVLVYSAWHDPSRSDGRSCATAVGPAHGPQRDRARLWL